MWRPAPPVLSAAEQYMHLRVSRLCAGEGDLRAGRFVWRYQTSPSPVSRLYSVRIEYRQGNSPRAFVDDPDLAGLTNGRRLQHVYEQRPARLCLYFPNCGQWCPWMRIDTTIVPWITLWLFYFEEWLVSNEWKGGGLHPGASDQRSRRHGHGPSQAMERPENEQR